MAMSFEEDEWDEEFMRKLDEAEELALTSTALQPPPPPPPQQQQNLSVHLPPRPFHDISYSPPRELSQRIHDSPPALRSIPSTSVSNSSRAETVKLQKIDGFKVKKIEQPKLAMSKISHQEPENCHANNNFLHFEGVPDDRVTPPEYRQNRSSDEMHNFNLNRNIKSVGVQTDNTGEAGSSKLRTDDPSIASHHQNKLLGIWDLVDGEKSGKDFALKLFEACATDFQVLSGYLSATLPASTIIESSQSKYGGPLQGSLPSNHAADTAKISHLFLMLTKISSEMVRLEDLLEALIDCCHLKNDAIVYGSLRVLHVVVKHIRVPKKLTPRGNFVLTGPHSEHIRADGNNQELFESGNLFYPGTENSKLNFQGTTWFKTKWNPIASNSPKVDWVLLFELMSHIVSENFDERVRLEGTSIMNTIVISCNAYSEREKFVTELAFQTVSLLLKKEAGLCMQKQAVNLFYLLLNCPKVTATFCLGCMEGDSNILKAEVDVNMISSVKEFRVILNGLVDCLSCTGNCTKKLKLRRSTITVIAYIASLGKSGIAILLHHKFPNKDSNILITILESLISDLDLEMSDTIHSFEVFRERTLLLREALILLNRLVSHPQFSSTVLQALTSGRDVTNLTVKVAKRLCHKGKFLWQDDRKTTKIRESETAELARLFKRRVFTFLGENVS